MQNLIHLQTVSCPPVVSGNYKITPVMHVIRLFAGRLTVQHPAAIVIEHDGQVEKKRITDLTRLVQMGLVMGPILFLILTGLRSVVKRKG